MSLYGATPKLAVLVTKDARPRRRLQDGKKKSPIVTHSNNHAMFAPPLPLRLSKAEIASRLAAQKAKAEDKSKADSQSTNPRKASLTSQQQRSDLFNFLSTRKNSGVGESSSAYPPQTPPPHTSPPQTPGERTAIRSESQPPSSEFENPRRPPPLPPKIRARAPSELFFPPPVGTAAQGQTSPAGAPRPLPPPPIPENPALRCTDTFEQQRPDSTLRPPPLFSQPLSQAEFQGSPVTTPSRTSPGSHCEDQPSTRLSSGEEPLQEGSDSSSTQSAVVMTGGNSPPRPTTASSEAQGGGMSVGSGSPSLLRRSNHVKSASVGRSIDPHSHQVTVQGWRTSKALRSSDSDSLWRLKHASAISKPAKIPVSHGVDRRKKKGETMSILIDSGFFPVEEIIYHNQTRPRIEITSRNFRVNLPPRLSFSEMDLQGEAPLSASRTPASLYRRSPTSPNARHPERRSVGPGRRPQSQMSENEVETSSILIEESGEASSHILTVVAENSTASGNSLPTSDFETPVATQIHLKGGSIVTVTSPKLPTWKPTVYLQGPIKLPKPAIMPRKDSIASLEPFQDMIDQVYQDVLLIPRRRSDDAAVDDICEFFDDYGFDIVGFDGDRLAVMDVDTTEGPENGTDADQERFSTPPPELPAASPVEVVIAKEVVGERLSGVNMTAPVPEMAAPPVENEETFRAKGIARISRISAGSAKSSGSIPVDVAERRESLISSRRESVGGLPLLPPPEDSMLDAVLQPSSRDSIGSVASIGSGHSKARHSVSYAASSRSKGRSDGGSHASSTHSSRMGRSTGTGSVGSGSQATSLPSQGFEWDDVAEMEAGSNWVAPSLPKKPGRSGKTRNPVSKVKQLVSTASTIL